MVFNKVLQTQAIENQHLKSQSFLNTHTLYAILDIRHISTSLSGHTIALAEFEKRVQIFDINSLHIISEFDTVLDFGGQRLAISEDGKSVFVVVGEDTEYVLMKQKQANSFGNGRINKSSAHSNSV
jgi:hypothetical protein